MHSWQIASLLATSLVFVACSDSGGEGVGSSSQTLTTSECATLDPARSLFVTGATELAKFPIGTVLNQIVSNFGPTGQTGATLYQQMVDTLNDAAHAQTQGPHCDDVLVGGKPSINGFPIQCPRQEGALAKTDPLDAGGDGYTALGLVNRFDLAPQNGSNCGQYRIVYGKNSGKTSPIDRMLLIFEATLPNPNPSAGIAACKPVTQFWADLSSDGDADSRASKLANFYLTGLPGFAAVVKAEHYGIGGGTDTGQIRANMFMFGSKGDVSGQQWELREFRLSRVCGQTTPCPLVAINTAVQVNPFGGLFGTLGASGAFQNEFLGQVEALASTDVNTIGMSTSDPFNAGQSDQSDTSNDYVVQAKDNTGLHQAVTAKLKEISRTDLTSDNILDRATTQSCAGCHQLSPSRNLGGGLTWPQSNVFTHITENRTLSPALTQTFLPFRGKVLTRFNDPSCGDAGTSSAQDIAVSANRTIGGGRVGAAN